MTDVQIVTAEGIVTRPASTDELAEAQVRETQAAANRLPNWRATATLSRMEMALALEASSILTEAQMLELCGGVIPAPLGAFIDLLPVESRKFARAATAAGQPFERASPIWTAVAAADTGPTESEIDALFGWTG